MIKVISRVIGYLDKMLPDYCSQGSELSVVLLGRNCSPPFLFWGWHVSLAGSGSNMISESLDTGEGH